jgi:hypothetical protein
LQYGAVVNKAGTVENHVRRADFLCEFFDFGVVHHVEFTHLDAGLAFEFREFCPIDVGGPDFRAFTRECERGRASDALCTGGDESHLAAESSSH